MHILYIYYLPETQLYQESMASYLRQIEKIDNIYIYYLPETAVSEIYGGILPPNGQDWQPLYLLLPETQLCQKSMATYYRQMDKIDNLYIYYSQRHSCVRNLWRHTTAKWTRLTTSIFTTPRDTAVSEIYGGILPPNGQDWQLLY